MKPLVLSLAVVLISCQILLAQSAPASSQPLIQSGDLVAICGDSITEQRIYSVFIEDYLRMCAPLDRVRALQAGYGGFTAGSFKPQMKQAVLTFSPNVATLCFGMNDGAYRAFDERTRKYYILNMTSVVKNFKEGGARAVIAGSPGAVDTTAFKRTTPEIYNETLRLLGEEGKKVAEAEGVAFADLHTVMMETMAKAKAKKGAGYIVCGGDGLHPGNNGHLIMAYAFLKAMGFDGNIGTITCNAQTGKATATEGHTVTAFRAGEIQLESTRYPFCFSGKADSLRPADTAGIIEFFPFNADLNRYTLVVKGLAAPKAKVTWGNADTADSREFTAEELARGVNLADVFVENNPFQKAFKDVDNQVQRKQYFETTYVKNILSSFGILQAMSDDPEGFAEVEGKFRAIHQKMQERVAAAKKPVAHTISIKEVK
jgi:lysophospholipase L1-like esterase